MSKGINLQEYIGKKIQCSCGKVHFSNVKCIDIDRDAVKRLPVHIKELGYKKVYLVADKNTWKAAGMAAAKELEEAKVEFEKLVLDYDELIPDETVIGELMVAFPKDADLVLAVGSGTINDLCKFISFQMGVDYIIFASAPSMDGFVSVGAALMLNHVKTTVDTHGPVAVIGDTEILAEAPMNMITAGLGDTLGKYTCLLDWKLAHIINEEYYCEEVVNMVCRALETVMEQSGKIEDRNPEAIKAVTEALVLTGMAMSFVGNSRPASGCEHHLSHYWEMKFIMEGKKPILHGTKVGIGMITALKLYHMLAEENVDFDAAMNKVYDKEAWISKINTCYEVAANGIIKLEEKSQKNDVEARNKRLAVMKEKWPMIQKTIKESLPKTEEMEKLLLSLDAPVNPEQIGVSLQLVEDGVQIAKEVRDRYTVLQILWDLGLSENYSQKLVSYYEKEQEVYYQWLKEQTKEKIDKIKCFVLDMDGTIYLENNLFPFTKNFLDKVEETGRSYCYFTNNSSKNQKDYLDKLEKLSIPVTADRMFLSTQVILEYLEEHHKGESYYVVGTPSLVKAFEEAGFQIDEENPDVVILGFDTTLTYEKISKACQFIRHGAHYYGVNMDYNCPMAGGEYIPDCGSIAKLVERSTGRFPEFFGKPSRHTLDYIVKHTGYQEEEIAVIGDRIYTDIALANDSKATSIMVLTGETQIKDLSDYDYSPDIIVDSLENLIEML